jgi:hypothetical protein
MWPEIICACLYTLCYENKYENRSYVNWKQSRNFISGFVFKTRGTYLANQKYSYCIYYIQHVLIDYSIVHNIYYIEIVMNAWRYNFVVNNHEHRSMIIHDSPMQSLQKVTSIEISSFVVNRALLYLWEYNWMVHAITLCHQIDNFECDFTFTEYSLAKRADRSSLLPVIWSWFNMYTTPGVSVYLCGLWNHVLLKQRNIVPERCNIPRFTFFCLDQIIQAKGIINGINTALI